MIPLGVYLVGAVVAAFGAIGFFRGWRRETWVLGGLVFGWGVVLLAGRGLVVAVNRVHLMLAFAAGGGFEPSVDATVLLDQLRARPLVSAAQPDVLYLAVLAATAAFAYVLSARAAPEPSTITSQLLGAPVGLANGYLLVYALIRFAGPALLGESVNPLARSVGQLVVPTLLVGGAAVVLLVLQRLRLQLGLAGSRQAGRSRRP
jgi:hypothetical protein